MASKKSAKRQDKAVSRINWQYSFNRYSAIAFIIIGSLSLLALLTFQNDLPSSNWLGTVGYWTAYVCRFLLGLVALPLFGWMILRGSDFLQSKERQEPLPVSLVLTSILSSALLLNIVAENYPQIAKPFASWVHIQSFASASARVKTQEKRLNMGGVPLYFLYKDLPHLNLRKLLSDRGLSLICTCTLLATVGLYLSRRRAFLQATVIPKRSSSTQPLFEDSTPPLSALNLLQETRLAKLPQKAPTKPAQKVSPDPIEKSLEPSSASKAALPASALHLLKKAKAAAVKAGAPACGYTLPTIELLTAGKPFDPKKLDGEISQQSRLLEETLLSFGIEGKVAQVHVGPRLLSIEVQPAIGVKVQRIKALENDIALNLEAKSLRIIAPIPGKAAVGIEIPTKISQEVNFKNMVASYQALLAKGTSPYAIPVILGKTVSGEDVHFDLAKMPHMIIAGATGSGKSVCVNTLIVSILLHASPDDIKLLMVDPKKVELTPYSKLPHMIAPVVTEPAEAAEALRWLVVEMEKRYEILKRIGLRHIEAFNTRVRDEVFESTLGIEVPIKFPYIVGIIDELADLMMTSPADIETPIARIAQMARAVGIHLVLATQRPSREVITGLIKANFPARIAFKVSSRVNSQIILDETGAECLLGNGDMLFLHPTKGSLIRAQGAYIRDEDINRVVETIEMQAPPNYLLKADLLQSGAAARENAESEDELFEEAKKLVLETGTASTTFLQRKLRVGYARAASLMDELELHGIVSASEGGKPRKVLGKLPGVEKEESFE